jgi:chromosome segregation protein
VSRSPRSLQWATSSWSPPLFLKSVDISGFKSFGRPSRLELPRGITALVGPNGSGKSNVVDAIRWCLGEQSVRDLRSQRTEDVIHAGPRRALGMADVTLTFEDDSTTHAGPAETTVGRRLYRSGESEYLVDGRKVRLRDVHDVLGAIGIDGARYIVVTQGMTDAWLTATAAERRALLEHAAGLSSYRTRRDECRHKLQTTAQNMTTIEVVLAELEPRLRVLRRQSRAVQDRDEARARITATLTAWYGWHWSQIQQRIEDLTGAWAAAQTEREIAAGSLRELEERADQALAAERARRSRLETATAAFHAMQREHDAARFAYRDAQARRRSVDERSREVNARIEHLAAALVEAGIRRDEADGLARALDAERSTVEAALTAAGDELGERREAAAAAERLAGDLLAELRETESEQIETERRRAAHDDAARRARDRSVEAEQRLAELADLLVGLEHQLSLARARLSEHEAATRDARDALQRQEALAAEGRQRRARLMQLRDRVRARLAELERRQGSAARSLASLRQETEGGLLDAVRVPPGWEVGVAAALGPWGTAGRPREPVDAALLTWRGEVDREAPGLRWGDELAHGLNPHIVHPLLSTVFVETVEQAEDLWDRLARIGGLLVASPPLQIVTRHGEAVSALGHQPRGEHDSSARFLQLRTESSELERSIDRYRARLQQLIPTCQAAAEQVTEREAGERAARQSWQERSREVAAARGDVHDLERRAARTAEDRVRGEEAMRNVAMEEQRLAEASRGLDQQLAHLKLQRSEQVQRHGEAESRAAECRQSLADQETHVEELVRKLEGLQVRIEAQVSVIAPLGNTIERMRAEETQLLGAAANLVVETVRADEEVAAGQRRVEELSGILAEQEAHLKSVRAEAETLSSASEPPSLETTRKQVSDLSVQIERIAAQLEQAESERERLLVEIERELRVPVVDLPRDIESAPNEDDIRRLRTRATQYADVDPSVVEECAQLEERYVRLRDHLADLRDASEGLHGILTSTDREMKERFGRALDAVNAEFGRVFEVMLRGGSARLEQVDDEGGIGIRAQLPGRRARSSSAFSGGEKTLVASSLLFGVLRIRPTPFCVLDEVDAALDESNVDRYLGALRDISERTQIVVVTHNRATMAAADVLYGLTMDDEGISGLLSLRLDTYLPAV